MKREAPRLPDEPAFELFCMYEGGASREECLQAFGLKPHQVFDRQIEARGKGRLAHPMFVHLTPRQGSGGGRPWHRSEMSETEIYARAAEVRSRRPAP